MKALQFTLDKNTVKELKSNKHKLQLFFDRLSKAQDAEGNVWMMARPGGGSVVERSHGARKKTKRAQATSTHGHTGYLAQQRNDMASVQRFLNTKHISKKKVRSQLDLLEIADEGLRSTGVRTMAESLDRKPGEIARLIGMNADVSRTPSRKLPMQKSAQLLELAVLTAKGTDVFGSQEVFSEWLGIEQDFLNGRTPFEVAQTSLGIDLVQQELDRLMHGVYA